MGFEQLAALKQQLAMQAEAEKRVSQKKAPRPRTETKSEARVERSGTAAKAGARPERPRKEAKPEVDPVVITISRLQRQFPKAFPKKPDAKVPLKLGIHQELLGQAEKLGLEPEAITLAIKTWCQGSRYWACMTDGAERIDLAGEASGAVTAPEAQRARQLERRQRAKSHKRKAAPEVKAGADAATEGAAVADGAAKADGAAVAKVATDVKKSSGAVEPDTAGTDGVDSNVAVTESSESSDSTDSSVSTASSKEDDSTKSTVPTDAPSDKA